MTRQQVFDAIKQIRLGETVNVTLNTIEYAVHPMSERADYMDGYTAVVLCNLRGRIRFAEVCWKDAGPNPRLGNYFVNAKKIYGVCGPKTL